ncbi:hypothetical protein GIB67_006925, partial [Kingdonia uniflora]
STILVGNWTYLLRIDTVIQLCSSLGRHWTTTNWRMEVHYPATLYHIVLGVSRLHCFNIVDFDNKIE